MLIKSFRFRLLFMMVLTIALVLVNMYAITTGKVPTVVSGFYNEFGISVDGCCATSERLEIADTRPSEYMTVRFADGKTEPQS